MEMRREHLIKLVTDNVSAQMVAQKQDVMVAPNTHSPGLGIVVEGVLDVCAIGDTILNDILVWASSRDEEAYARGAADMARHLKDKGKDAPPAVAAPSPTPHVPPSPESVLDGVFARVEAECDSEGGEHD